MGKFAQRRSFILLLLGLSTALSSSTEAAPTASVHPQLLPLGKAMQLYFDPRVWFYHAPKFLEDSKVGVFEGQKLSSLHAFLRTDNYVTSKPDLTKFCDSLARQPLDMNLKTSTGKVEPLKISGADACRVTKSDAEQDAVQYIFVSQKTFKSRRQPASFLKPRYYTHYLYFYYPKKVKAEAAPLIDALVKGVGYRK